MYDVTGWVRQPGMHGGAAVQYPYTTFFYLVHTYTMYVQVAG